MAYRYFARISLLCLAMIPGLGTGLARADSDVTGSFAIIDDTGAVLMGLDLQDQNGMIFGMGVVPDAGLMQGPADVTVRFGSRLGEDLQLQLQIDPLAPDLPVSGARLVVQNGATTRLTVNGRIVTGHWQSVAPGTVALPEAIQDAPTAPASAAIPPAPAPAPPAPQMVATPPVCLQLDQVTAEVTTTAGPDVVQEVNSILALYGLSFGATATAAQCQGALQEITLFLQNPGSDANPEACDAVTAALTEIAARLEQGGNPPSTEPDRIIAAAGMAVPGLNPGGANTAETCGQALTGLYDFLDRIAQPQAAASDSISLPDDYRVEPIINVNIRGTWDLSAGGDRMAMWAQGENTIAWESGPDGRRTAWFWEPRDELRAAGVLPGTLFFEGTRDKTTMTGEIRFFVKDCGAYVYPVSGEVRRRETVVILVGQRPEVDASCAITGLRERSFRLRFVADNPPGTENLNSATRGATGANGRTNTPDFGIWAMLYEVRNVAKDGALNIRRNPSTNARIVGEMPANARDISMLGEGCTPAIDQMAYETMNARQRARLLNNRWCRISWNGRVGWVYGRYIRPQR